MEGSSLGTSDSRRSIDPCPLTPTQWHDRLRELNDTEVDYPRDQLVHRLFEIQVARAPAAVAVIHGHHRLTYAELNRRANQLAHHLLDEGMRVGDFVAILMPRSVDLLVTQIAILKAGGAYVPVDPELPGERQAFIIKQCGGRWLVCDDRSRLVAHPEGCRMIDFAAAVGSRGRKLDNVPASHLDTMSGAYVMFTSGSTGVPKGVVVSHRGISRLVLNNRYARIGARDCLVHSSNPAFDAATFEVWGALLNGARILLLPQSTVLDPAQLEVALSEGGGTILFLTTALFNRYVIAAPSLFSRLRYVLFGGEAADPNIVRRVSRAGWSAKVSNVYGPTETTAFATFWPLLPLEDSRESVPIGRPISNTTVYLLDKALQPVPTGVTGEIYIGGDGVACGYLARPDVTAERFVADPFGPRAGARLYRTGDLGRWNAEGDIEYLGRNDSQVKIRGFRIELGEVEAVLRTCPLVAQGVVVLREDRPGEKELVAYVIQDPSAGSERRRTGILHIRGYLAGKLPAYAIPKAIVLLERLPLTGNGKIDRRALPVPDRREYLQQTYVAARSPTELVVSAIWRDILRLEQVGTEDDFFELGGDSLHAMTVAIAVRGKFKIEVGALSIYQNPTIARLARLIDSQVLNTERAESAKHSVNVPRAAPRESRAFAPLTFQQEEFLRLESLYPDWSFWITSKLRIRGTLDLESLRNSVARLVNRHQVLRTRLISIDGKRMQKIEEAGECRLDVVTAAGSEKSEIEARMRKDAEEFLRERVDLSAGPLLKLKLFEQSGDEYLLAVAIHHIIADAVSLVAFFEELWTGYHEFAGGREPVAIQLPKQYSEYAIAQRDLSQSVLTANDTYWRKKLDGAAPIRMPVDRARGQVKEFTAAPIETRFDRALSEGLFELARAERCTPAIAMATLYAVAASQWSGQRDFVLWFQFTGRLDPEYADTIGLFVTALPLRFELSPRDSFVTTLRLASQEFLSACEHLDSGWFSHKMYGGAGGTSIQWVPWSPGELSGVPGTTGKSGTVSPLSIEPAENRTAWSEDGWPDDFRFDGELLWRFANTGRGIEGHGYYRADLFEPTAIDEFLRTLHRTAYGVVHNPTAPVAAFGRASR